MTTEPNTDELDELLERLVKRQNYPVEWSFALNSGWVDKEFERLYLDYLYSTQIELKPTDDKTKLKGVPLEKLSHYLLKEGGIVTDIREINDPGRWQVDGQGTLSTSSMLNCFGRECHEFGTQLYLEAKNHSDAITSDAFSQHYRRMDEHRCHLGVCLSTSGFPVGRGLGIANSVYINSVKGKFHILLSFHSIYSMVNEKKAPLTILKEAYNYTISDLYSNDKAIQEWYSSRHNNRIAREEYEKRF